MGEIGSRGLSAEPRTVSIFRATFSGTFNQLIFHISVDFHGFHAAPRHNKSSHFLAKKLFFSLFPVWISLNLSAFPTISWISYRCRELLRVFLIIIYSSLLAILFHVVWCYKHSNRMRNHGYKSKIHWLYSSNGIRLDIFRIIFLSHFFIYFNLFISI
jgi:hypothetical protein